MQWLLLSLALSCGYMPQNTQMVNLRMESATEFINRWIATPPYRNMNGTNQLITMLESRDAAIRADEAAKCDADFKLYKDGDKWCCVRRGFIDLQESDAWFGDTPEEALRLAIT